MFLVITDQILIWGPLNYMVDTGLKIYLNLEICEICLLKFENFEA